MNLLKEILILVIGFVLLIKGADYFVGSGSSSVARRLKVPSLIIGMTIVAMGTSLPECAVSVTASLAGNNTLAVSNVVGSNIFDLMVVCGVCTLFAPLTIKKDTLQKEFPLFHPLCHPADVSRILRHDTGTRRRCDSPDHLCRISPVDDPGCQNCP